MRPPAQSRDLPVSLAALYDKIKRTDPDLLGALVRASAERLEPVLAELGPGPARLPGYALRVIEGNHLPASEKRLTALRACPGAALPGTAIVVYDPDSGLVTDLVAGEDAYEHERVLSRALFERAEPGQVWIGDRHFCPGALLRGWDAAGAGFVVREHARHPRLSGESAWRKAGRTETGRLREQAITLADPGAQAAPWRRIELTLDRPSQAGERILRVWTNLPAQVSAAQIAQAYRDRWRIEGMFQRLERVLHSEITSLGHPRAALLGFGVALLAYNVLALIEALRGAGADRRREAGPDGVAVSPRPAGPQRLRGPAHRPAGRLRDGTRGRSQGPGRAPAGAWPGASTPNAWPPASENPSRGLPSPHARPTPMSQPPGFWRIKHLERAGSETFCGSGAGPWSSRCAQRLRGGLGKIPEQRQHHRAPVEIVDRGLPGGAAEPLGDVDQGGEAGGRLVPAAVELGRDEAQDRVLGGLEPRLRVAPGQGLGELEHPAPVGGVRPGQQGLDPRRRGRP